MTFEQIIQLINAGFTRDDIMALFDPQSIGSPPTADPAPEPASPEPEPPADPAPVQNPVEPVQNSTGAELAEIKETLAAMQKAIYAGNIIGMSQPAGAGTGEPTTEDILANILDPSGHPLK